MLIMPTGTVRLRVPEIAKSKNLSVKELVEATGLSRNTASALMRGFYDRIGLDTIARLCDGLDVEPGELFEYRPEPESG